MQTASDDRSQVSSTGDHPGRPRKRLATINQIRVLNTIASRNEVDLADMLKACGVQYITDLTIGDASRLIDELRRRPPKREPVSA